MRLIRTGQPSCRGCLSDQVRSVFVAALALAMLATALLPATTTAQSGSNELGIEITFPDGGLNDGEQLCLALYPGDADDLTVPPLQSRCLDPGDDVATFAGIASGAYQLITPSVGSIVEQNRYQVQSAETSIPAETSDASFIAGLPLSLTPEVSGTTGQVQLNVYGCPPGTDGQGDATLWQSQCTSPVAGVSLALQGIGSIEDTSVRAVTQDARASAGKVKFSDLPPGEYELVGVDVAQFANVATNPALVIESNIDGSLGVIDPNQGISLRPAEIKNIDIYFVLTDHSAPIVISPVVASVAIGAPTGTFASGNPSTAAVNLELVQHNLLPEVAGGLAPDEIADRAMDEAPAPDS
ncbi:MAG: hypothetical protein M3457_20700 [Chloroflexota bacterium]|nr:hypothetical protein [Chloroflexota bacterium]